jgi:hypothetical protein
MVEALAATAASALVQAMVTDGWEGFRHQVARLFGRGQPDLAVERRLDAARSDLTAAPPAELPRIQGRLAAQWETRLSDFLADYPEAARELESLVAQIRASTAAASDHSLAARDVSVLADRGAVSAGVIHGPVSTGPYLAGSGVQLAGSGIAGQFGPGSAAAVGGLAIGTFVQGPRQQAARLPVSLPPRLAGLAGREDLLALVHERVTAGDPPRVVVLCGLGGVGKTSLAAEYAHRHLGEVGIAWQIPAEDATIAEQGMAELAAQAGGRELADLRDPVASVHAVLAAWPADWLLIFDNAPDEASVRRLLPPAGRGRVLVTSQSQRWAAAEMLHVPMLDAGAAARFLADRVGDPDLDAADVLARELGGLPLALEQAAAYIRTAGLAAADYLSLLRQRKTELLDRGVPSAHPASAVATLALAMSRLEHDNPAAAGLMRLLACLAAEPAPLALLLPGTGIPAGLDPDVAAALGQLAADQLALADAVAALSRYSLSATAGSGTILVHRLVQAAILDQMPAGLAGRWRAAAAALVEAAIPDNPYSRAAWPACAGLLPHALAVLDLTSAGAWRIASASAESGSYATARDLFLQIAQAHQGSAAYGPHHPATLTARASLADLTGEAGNPAEARDLLAALLPDLEHVSGTGHPDTLTARASLAYWTGRAGNPGAARDLAAALLPDLEDVSGTEHPDTLTARASLARWTGEAGNPVGARDLYAALLPVRERISGGDHPYTLGTRASIAHWTGAAGNPAAARDLVAALLPELERVSGAEHPETLAARADMAQWTGQAGDSVAARDQYAALIPVTERVSGTEHPDTLAARQGLAHWTGQAGNPVVARDLYAALIPVVKRVSGAEHPDTLAARNGLAYWTSRAHEHENQ